MSISHANGAESAQEAAGGVSRVEGGNVPIFASLIFNEANNYFDPNNEYTP